MSCSSLVLRAVAFAAAITSAYSAFMSSAALPPRGRTALRQRSSLAATLCDARSPSPDPGERYPSPTGKDSKWQFQVSLELPELDSDRLCPLGKGLACDAS